jgi:hypothetical protein
VQAKFLIACLLFTALVSAYSFSDVYKGKLTTPTVTPAPSAAPTISPGIVQPVQVCYESPELRAMKSCLRSNEWWGILEKLTYSEYVQKYAIICQLKTWGTTR